MSAIAQISRIYPEPSGTIEIPVYPGKRMISLISFTLWGRTTDFVSDIVPIPTSFETYLMFGFSTGSAVTTVYKQCHVNGVLIADPVGDIPQVAAATICLSDRIDFPGGLISCYLFLPSWAHTTGSAWQSTTIGEYL